MRKTFISYSSLTRGFVAKLHEDLQLIGITAWVDSRELPPTPLPRPDMEIEHTLRAAIDASDSFILVLNGRSLASRWVQLEVAHAISSARRRPGFSFVPIVDDASGIDLPEAIRAFSPIDFSRGYNTALVQFLERLGIDSDASVAWRAVGLSAQKSFASRQLASGVTLTEHIRSLLGDSNVRNFVLSFAGRFSTLQAQNPADILANARSWANMWLDHDCIVLGNEQEIDIAPRRSLSLVLSCIPTPGTDDDSSLVALASFFRGGRSLREVPDCTLAAEYRHDGGANLWLGAEASLHHYTMGSPGFVARLLTPNRRMGVSRHVFVWSIQNPPSVLLTMRQGLHNKQGGGLLAVPFAAMIREMRGLRGEVRRALEKIAEENWATPITRQEQSFISHLALGGIFVYEVGPLGVSSMVAHQMQHLLACADAEALAEDHDRRWPYVGQQWLSVSRLQRDELSL